MNKILRPLLVMIGSLHAATVTPNPQVEAESAAEFEVEQVTSRMDLQAFTWDERGALWVVSGRGSKLKVLTAPQPWQHSPELVTTLERRETGRAGLLVHEGHIFVSGKDRVYWLQH